jgi:hypothetical protein
MPQKKRLPRQPRAQRPPKPSPAPSIDSAGSSVPTSAAFMDATAYIPEFVDDGVQAAEAEAEAEAVDDIPAELVASALGPTFQAAFHFAASIRGPHWELEEFERTAFVVGWTPIVRHLLAKLGSQEQIMVTMAVVPTMAIIGGKLAKDLTKPASSKASIKTRASGVSSASSVSATEVRQPEQSNSFEEQDE